jgi:mRNA-decapping enzyme 1B
MPSGIQVDASQRHAITANMNLAVLRRLDPAVTAVLCSASQVAVYELPPAPEGEQPPVWERCDVEGSLYIVARDAVDVGDASHRIVVVNRKSPLNFVDDVTTGDMEFETADGMIMFQNVSGRVIGLWFYVPAELAPVYKCMNAIAEGQPPVPPVPPGGPPAVRPAKEANGSPRAAKRKGKASQARPGPAPQAAAAELERVAGAAAPPVAAPVAGGGGVVAADAAPDSLTRFFPNLKLTNGVAGASPPSTATRAPPSPSKPPAAESDGSQPNGDAVPSQPPVLAPKPPSSPPVAPPAPPAAGPAYPQMMPVPPPGIMPLPHFVPPPTTPAQYHQMLLMNMNMLQRQDMMLAGQMQQAAAAVHTSSRPQSGDPQQTLFYQQQLQQLQHQQMQTRQHIAQLQPQLAMAQTQASVGLPVAPPFPGRQSPPLSPPAARSGPARAANGGTSPAKSASLVGTSVAGLAPGACVGSTRMDRSQFRGLLQRMLSDKKLFECAFAAYERADLRLR